jgi:sugar lactone lactonase YvrE
VIAATADAYALAEGPLWDPRRRRLLWVDIVGGAVFEGTLHDGVITVAARHDFDNMVGAVAFAEDGTLLVAAQEQLVVVQPDGTRRDGPRVVAPGTRRRLNDGAVAPDGRFLVGTLALDGGSASEQLVRLERDGTLTVLDDDLALSNGLAWSTDGRRMYSVDTLRRTVYVRDRGGERRVHLVVDDGDPDGIAVDADDHLWVALWGAGAVARYSPAGTLVDRIAVPAPHTSSVAFAGDDLRTLVVTTAHDQLSDEQRTAFPDSGRLFTTRTDVAGLPATAWETI